MVTNSLGTKIEPPHRVVPGRLSVSRSFGDCQAKLECYGGNPKVIIPTPEIEVHTITSDTEFILMGSDGIFDYLDNKQI